MDIKDFKKRKLKLDRDIVVAITKLVDIFEDETGYTPSAISVNMLDHFDIGVQYSRHIVGGVDTRIDL